MSRSVSKEARKQLLMEAHRRVMARQRKDACLDSILPDPILMEVNHEDLTLYFSGKRRDFTVEV